MTITDVPQSGQYFQRGSVVQLVVQLNDENTGLPVPLQSATDLFIDILYPDNAGMRSFVATLYTDGSDGRIAYITQNDGMGYSDLNQVGLYKMQARASIGGVPLPPSQENNTGDFYILPNVADKAIIPVNYPVLQSKGGFMWQVYVLTTGNLDTLPVTSGNPVLTQFYMRDKTGQNWIVTVDDTGHLVTSIIVGPVPSNQQIYLVDSVQKQWVVTVLGPNLKTT
jgi:hypothetical protein